MTSTSAAESVAPQVAYIPIDELHESPFNPRRTFAEAGLQELADDISHVGILQPLRVRPRVPPLFSQAGDTELMAEARMGFEVVFGHRRLRAARLAGLASVPCLVCAMTDEQAKRAQLSENLAREDVHAIEEAEGFAALMHDHGISADQLAEQTGKSRSYIYGRLTLLKACKSIRDACLAGEIGSEVALLIARLRTERLQQKALGYIKGKYIELGDGGAKSFRAVRDLLREHFTLALSGKACLFDPADAQLLPNAGACTTCTKRTGNAPEYADMLDDTTQHGYVRTKGDAHLCTDPDCYGEKKLAHLRAAAASLEAAGATVIDGARARQAIGADGQLKGAYVAVADVRQQLAAARRAAQKDANVAPVQVVTIQDPRTGKTVQAVKAADLQHAGVQVPPDVRRSDTANRQRAAEDGAAREAAARIERAVRSEVLARVRAAVATTERSPFDLGLVARAMLANVDWEDREPLAQLYGAADFHALEGMADCMNTDELGRLMMDCALVRDFEPNPWALEAVLPVGLELAATHYGIDPVSVRAELAAAAAQTSAPAASTPSTAARAPQRAPAAARGVRYRDPATGSTWSGRGLQPAWLKAALANGKTLADFDVPTQEQLAGGAGNEQMDDDAGVAAGAAVGS